MQIQKKVTHNKCELCGYEWEPKKKNIKCCPKCKRYDWEKR